MTTRTLLWITAIASASGCGSLEDEGRLEEELNVPSALIGTWQGPGGKEGTLSRLVIKDRDPVLGREFDAKSGGLGNLEVMGRYQVATHLGKPTLRLRNYRLPDLSTGAWKKFEYRIQGSTLHLRNIVQNVSFDLQRAPAWCSSMFDCRLQHFDSTTVLCGLESIPVSDCGLNHTCFARCPAVLSGSQHQFIKDLAAAVGGQFLQYHGTPWEKYVREIPFHSIPGSVRTKCRSQFQPGDLLAGHVYEIAREFSRIGYVIGTVGDQDGEYGTYYFYDVTGQLVTSVDWTD